MQVSQIAINQWKQLCKRHANTHPDIIISKIQRAIMLGQVKHIYKDANMIVRYHDLNLLVSNNEVQTIWRDITASPVDVCDKLKALYEEIALTY